jgi:peptidyl-prolyl cis-trans isomerase C
MPRFSQFAALSITAIALTGVAGARAQETQTKSAPPTGAPAGAGATAPGGIRQEIPGLNDVLATIVDGTANDKVTKGELLQFLTRYQIPDDEDRQELYSGAMDRLINTKLLMLFLARQQLPIGPEKVDEQIEQLKGELKKDGQDLATALVQNGVSLENIRKTYEDRLRWSEYLKKNATEATLRKYLADHRDLFMGTQIRASHILIKVDSDAPAAEKEKAKQQLVQIKTDIKNGTTTFAAAANKFSQDQANSGMAGGDLDYFTLASGYPEEFTDVAFKLKKAVISDPVETPFGFHLIQVTDRKEGKPVDFEQNKPYILQEYGNELQRNVVNAERQRAKIDIKPMPKDLFPPQAPSAPATGGGAAPKSATATPKS